MREKTWVAVGGQYDLLCPVAVTSDRPVSGMSSRLWLSTRWVASTGTSRMLSRRAGVVIMGRSAHRAIAG